MSLHATILRRPMVCLAPTLALSFAVSLLLGVAAPAAAANIVPVLSTESLSPAFDPGAVQLGVHMQAAADHWSSILQDDVTITIVYGYQLIPGSDTGRTCLLDPGGVCLDGENDLVDALTPAAAIAIDVEKPDLSPREYFFDPTPNDHSEFAMAQVLFRDLSNFNQLLYFDGDAPDRLEVSYFGAALPTAPPEAQSGEDMMTIALHEMGHALGMLNELVHLETADGDYDIDPSFVQWYSLGAKVGDDSPEHLWAPKALMAATAITGERRLPSATDVFGVASAGGWQDIQLRRSEFWIGSIFNLETAWSGGNAPDATTDASVRSGSSPPPELVGDVSLLRLLVADDTVLSTAGFELQVSNIARVEAGDGTGPSELAVESDATVGGLIAGDGGIVSVEASTLSAILATIEPGGTLTGTGQLDAWAVENDGLLAGAADGLLTVDTFGTSADLDGDSETGAVEAIEGSLRFADTPADPFDGSMTIAPGRSIDAEAPWTLGANGVLHLAGDAVGPEPLLEGAEAEIQGTIEVVGHARSTAPLRLGASGTIDLAADAVLETDAQLELAGGTAVGDGVLHVDAGAVVTADTTLTARIVDLDGTNDSALTVLANHSLDLQVEGIEEPGHQFDGTLSVVGETAWLRIDLDDPTAHWILAGQLFLEGSDVVAATQLAGSDVLVEGTIEVDGRSGIKADIDLTGTLVTVDAQAEAILESGGVNTIRGSAIASSDVTVEAGTTLRLEDGFEGWTRIENRGRLELLGLGGSTIADPRVSSYTAGPVSVLAIDLGGTTAGVNHDRLRTLTGAQLAGRLVVTLVGGFVPSAGDRFEIVRVLFGPLSGSWAQLVLPPLPPPLAWQVDLAGSSATLEVVAVR